tara:strand:+ start:580 stop:765 length:186 start_codon:yes stop_codon:yes gene_type:complete
MQTYETLYEAASAMMGAWALIIVDEITVSVGRMLEERCPPVVSFIVKTCVLGSERRMALMP